MTDQTPTSPDLSASRGEADLFKKISRVIQLEMQFNAFGRKLPDGTFETTVADIDQLRASSDDAATVILDLICLFAASAGKAEPAPVAVPAELRELSARACQGDWTAAPFLDDSGNPIGEGHWWIHGGWGNLGGDFDEADAKLVEGAVNDLRARIAAEDGRQLATTPPASDAGPHPPVGEKAAADGQTMGEE